MCRRSWIAIALVAVGIAACRALPGAYESRSGGPVEPRARGAGRTATATVEAGRTASVPLEAEQPAIPAASARTPAPPSGEGAFAPRSGDVVALLADPPPAMASVEIDAWHGQGYEAFPGSGYRDPTCPTRWESPLTDRELWLTVSFRTGASYNPVPDGAAWLIAAAPAHVGAPDLPAHARLRGHLGDPAFVHCRDADRILTVDEVVHAYVPKRPAPRPIKDFAGWPEFLDPAGRFAFAYPPGWEIEVASADRIELSGGGMPDRPITILAAPGGYRPTPDSRATPVETGSVDYVQAVPDAFVEPGIPPLPGRVRFCAGRLPDGCIEVVFQVGGADYLLRHRFPTGFDFRQDSLWMFQGVVDSFRVEGRPHVTPTPEVHAALGRGQFWTKDQAEAMALELIPHGPWRVADARLVSEAEALSINLCDTRRDQPDYQWYTFPTGVWVVELDGMWEDRPAVYYTYLDATNGHHLCTAEKRAAGPAR